MLAETKTEPGELTSAAQDKGRYPSKSNLRHEYEQQTREDDMDRLEILDFVESVINLVEHDSHELIHNTKSNMKAQNTVSLY